MKKWKSWLLPEGIERIKKEDDKKVSLTEEEFNNAVEVSVRTQECVWLIEDFSEYLRAHPRERFMQALRNWLGVVKVYIEFYEEDVDDLIAEDTFYFENHKVMEMVKRLKDS